MKEKAFAASVNRDTIRECEALGLTLDEFVEISLGAMQGVADRLGL
jgi:predicted hydrolase (HD superfamily)